MSRKAVDLALKRCRANGGRSVSENEVELGGSPIDRIKRELKFTPRVSEAQAAENRAASRDAALSSLPVVGNIMAARDAYGSGKQAAEDFKAGRYGDFIKNRIISKATALSAMLGLPVGRTAANAVRGASSRTNVFVPSVQDDVYDRVHEQRRLGMKNHSVANRTGRVFSAEGKLLEEIPDRTMQVNKELIAPGAKMQLGDLIQHPELFEHYPHLRNIPVEFTPVGVDGKPFRGGLTRADGSFLLSSNVEDQRGDVAKLLQHVISAESGMSPGVRHSLADVYGNIEGSAALARQGRYRKPSDVDAVNAYLQQLGDAKGSVDGLVGQGLIAKATDRFGRRSAGNVLAKRVQARVTMPEQAIPFNRYPFGGEDVDFAKQIPLLRREMTPDQIREAIVNYKDFGAGKGYADGGRVKAAARGRRKLAVGALKGITDGRADKLPVTLPAGSYVIPADIVSALGEGNTAAGFKKLDARFKKGAIAKKNGGGVEAIVSDGEFIVSPGDVAALGGGDAERGYAALDLFVKGVRQAHIARLKAIPDPAK